MSSHDSSNQSASSISEQLGKLAELQKSGALTDIEFTEAKRKLLNGDSAIKTQPPEINRVNYSGEVQINTNYGKWYFAAIVISAIIYGIWHYVITENIMDGANKQTDKIMRESEESTRRLMRDSQRDLERLMDR